MVGGCIQEAGTRSAQQPVLQGTLIEPKDSANSLYAANPDFFHQSQFLFSFFLKCFIAVVLVHSDFWHFYNEEHWYRRQLKYM